MMLVSLAELAGLQTANQLLSVHELRFFHLGETVAVVPSLYPFFTFLAKCLNVRILPVPCPVRLLDLSDQW